MIQDYIRAYQQYCWPVNALADLKLAPFHLLATEGMVHVNRDHVWHMETLAKVCRNGDGLLTATPFKAVWSTTIISGHLVASLRIVTKPWRLGKALLEAPKFIEMCWVGPLLGRCSGGERSEP